MKKSRLLSGLLIVVLMVFSFGGAAFAHEHLADTVVDIAVDTEGEFDTLVAALTEAGLVETLQGEGPFTVFAPTDEAFANLLAALEIEAEDLLAHPQLEEVLLYHVVSGKVMSEDLETGDVETLLGENVAIDASTFMVNDAEILVDDGLFDLEAENGVVHVIDTVLVPDVFELDYSENGEEELQSIVEIAQANDDFSILVEALVAADLVDALEDDGPFTVFAPTNDAFAALLEALDIEKDDLLEHPDLADVLLYHVVEGAVFSTDLEEGMEPETLQGETVMISLEDGVFVNDSEVIDADIEASNGVIHAIDEVLVPEAFGAEEEEVPQTGDIGMIPFVVAGAAGLSGLWIVKKRK
ncbi:fasciclin domain-containing protein [Isachenkonia alkalipeptolytica]|uniref:LPXTG cell wall anchor domain-containing protein n=1 Tax=Isachenkonia alkalipeptolytica TaxID=2565777 RepID=A0AA44BEV7_9CLOT|nr:fasciclin domain-containing protein [Isachenkonia alkalipeptolytica]NBG89397.1 LPXTG cell wall anchor domain-containing protein [Isachenkonia alkalipeptolytica]